MRCDAARELLPLALDGAAVPGLEAHLRACPACAEAWRRLQSVEALLQGQPLVEPPAGLPGAVMHRLAPFAPPDSALPVGRPYRAVAAAVVAGCLLLVVVLAARGGLAVGAPLPLDQAFWLADAGGTLVQALVMRLSVGPVVWLSYAALALAMAAMWFGALVVPRMIHGPAGTSV